MKMYIIVCKYIGMIIKDGLLGRSFRKFNYYLVRYNQSQASTVGAAAYMHSTTYRMNITFVSVGMIID